MPTRPCINRSRLEARLASDCYSLAEHPSDLHVRGWVAAMRHVREVILPEIDAHERMLDALRELRDSQPVDLRLKHLLIVEDSLISERAQYGLDERFDFSEASA